MKRAVKDTIFCGDLILRFGPKSAQTAKISSLKVTSLQSLLDFENGT